MRFSPCLPVKNVILLKSRKARTAQAEYIRKRGSLMKQITDTPREVYNAAHPYDHESSSDHPKTDAPNTTTAKEDN